MKELDKRLRIFQVNLDMEKICVYIQQEVESAIEPTEDQRMFIAQIALIDKQITSLIAGLGSAEINEDQMAITNLVSLIDEDELSLICKELGDLKQRLGLDTQRIPAMDWGSVGVYTRESLTKIKLGLSFFGEGTKLLVADVQYAWLLTLKAAQGYTLKPREVNSIRRTGKDLLTLIPFTIILIIPLSPVGHVLVFGFIQRFFPEFYPSCYTVRLYVSIVCIVCIACIVCIVCIVCIACIACIVCIVCIVCIACNRYAPNPAFSLGERDP